MKKIVKSFRVCQFHHAPLIGRRNLTNPNFDKEFEENIERITEETKGVVTNVSSNILNTEIKHGDYEGNWERSTDVQFIVTLEVKE